MTQRTLDRRRLHRVQARSSRSVVVRQRPNQVRRQMRRSVAQDGFRHSRASAHCNASDSGHHRLGAQLNTSNGVKAPHRHCVNRQHRELTEDPWGKRAADKKGRRAFTVSRHNNELVCLLQRNLDRQRVSLKGGGRGHRERRRHQGRDNPADFGCGS